MLIFPSQVLGDFMKKSLLRRLWGLQFTASEDYFSGPRASKNYLCSVDMQVEGQNGDIT